MRSERRQSEQNNLINIPFIALLFFSPSAEPIDDEICLIGARPRRVTPPLSFKDCFIHYEDVKLEEELGRGNFGVVYRGRILSMEVAVKRSLDIKNNQAFREEAEVMHKLSHQRIMRFLGFCCDAPDNRVLIITEFMANGALCAYLKTTEGRRLDYRHLISIIDQVGAHYRSLTFFRILLLMQNKLFLPTRWVVGNLKNSFFTPFLPRNTRQKNGSLFLALK